MHLMYILHTRPYRETSLILEGLTEKQGRISLIARGAKRNKSPFKHILQPFIPLLVDWRGKSELHTLTSADAIDRSPQFSSRQLFSALYVNELMMYLLYKHDPAPGIFYLYQQVIQSPLGEVNLRYFEKRLLEELGYALQITHLAETNEPIDTSKNYLFQFDLGVRLAPPQIKMDMQHMIFPGTSLQAIANDDFSNEKILKDAKRLMRFALNHLLNGKKLKARELFL